MQIIPEADSLHRLVKQAIDSGRASTLDEAAAIFAGYRLTIAIADANDPAAQAALLTAVALGRRVFLGGVSVSGDLGQAHLTPLPFGGTLRDAIIALGGREGNPEDGVPTITIGTTAAARTAEFHVRVLFHGWQAGVVPIEATAGRDQAPMALSPMLAAALAVHEAYAFLSGDRVAGRRTVGLSLWNLGANDWRSPESDGPILQYLPNRLWLIGLGHLGQAYLWALGLLPYANPDEVELVLQDVDRVTASTESTSVLTDGSMLRRHKTRVAAEWAERRRFNTRVHERLFDAQYRRQPDEPRVALCGLDNADGRRALDKAGFDFVVETGLGRNYRNFQTMRLHTLPATRAAEEIWPRAASAAQGGTARAYDDLLKTGRLDQCGVTLLAGKAVGAPFVGAIAACLAVSEVLRLLAGGSVNELIDLDLRAVDFRAVVASTRDFATFNPGYSMAAT